MTDWEQLKNDGWEDVEYEFGLNEENAKRVSRIINEACHVFYHHSDGNWKSLYKERYASELAEEFRRNPELSSRVLRSKDRVVKMVAYRALEIIRNQE
jgi:hypothetical protein